MIPQQDSGLIVIVEDPFIRTFLSSILTRAGFRTAELGQQAGLDLVLSGELNVKALITNTPKAFRSVAGRFPVIYTTSCPDPEAIRGFPRCRVLQKPFHAVQLLEALHEVSAAVVA